MRIQVSALEKNQAGPDRTDRSPACSSHSRKREGGRGRAGRAGQRGGGGREAMPRTQAGGKEGGRVAAAAASSARATAAAPRERRSAGRAPVRRAQSPPAATPTDSEDFRDDCII